VKKLVVLLFVLLSVQLLLADTLMGRIHDRKNSQPVPGVSVSVQNTNKGTLSDASGKFIITDLEPGKYVIIFSRMGYESLEMEIDFPAEHILNINVKRNPTKIEGLKVSSTVAVERQTPVTFSNMDKEEITDNLYGQDIPLLMNEMPNVLSYSDAGSAMGYSYLNIRGFDQKHIGVMINGIPLNDPEDHQVYWVDMPDLAESLSNLQFQRGVGSSIYGISTFGGSLNLQTNQANTENGTEVFSIYGSYNTQKYGVKTTQDILNYFKLNLRLSSLSSDGYRDNSATKQYSYFASLSKQGDRSLTELNFYGGKERTHAAWDASGESALAVNHQDNPITYDNELDVFSQPHLELHHSYLINDDLNTQNSFFYIYGNGYYEQYKDGKDLWEYGLASAPDSLEADLIRQKHVKKNQYGWVGNLDWNHPLGKLTAGCYISLYNGDHWGEIKSVIGADTLGIDYEKGQKYYRYTGDKSYYTFYLNELFQPMSNLSVMANLYFQKIDFEFTQKAAGNFSGAYLNSYKVDYDFFNPRFGVNYNLNEAMNVYTNISFAQREPTDDELFDFWDGPDDLGVSPLFAHADTIYVDGEIDHIKWSDPYVKDEKLTDLECGFGYDFGNWQVKTNLFWMNFHDEIVDYGGVNDDGDPIRGNADETVHRGVEFTAKTELPYNFSWDGSFSYNDNYFKKFIMKDWDANWNVIDVDYSGNKIGGFPAILASTKLAYHWQDLLASVQVQHVGQQYLDNTENDDRSVDAYQLVNLGVSYKFSELFGLADVALHLRFNNLLDKEYETSGYYDSWEGENYYYPGAGRNLIAGIRVGF